MAADSSMYDGIELVITSTMKHNKNVHWYIFTMNIHCLINGCPRDFYEIDENQKNKLLKVIKYFDPNSTLEVMNVAEYYVKHIEGNPNEQSGFTPFATLRLLADVALPEVDDILYFDCDIAVQEDISEMYYSYLNKGYNYCAYSIPEACNYESEMVSGVLLFNLDKIRKTKFMEKARKNLHTHEYVYPDQMALRDVENPYPLPETYSYMFPLEKCSYKPAILHFTNQLSPKVYQNNEKTVFYRKYPQFNYVIEINKMLEKLNLVY